jgi:hypothetical protein
MDIPKAILVSALIIAASYILGNLFKLEVADNPYLVYRVNTVTGTVSFCMREDDRQALCIDADE